MREGRYFICTVVVTCVTLLLDTVTSKQLRKTMKIWQLVEAKCVFMGRYGSTRSQATGSLYHQVDWSSAEHRDRFGNMKLSFIGLLEQGHRKATEMIDVSDSRITESISAQVVTNHTFSLQEDFRENFDLRLPSSAHMVYFYVCDHHHSTAAAYKEKLAASRTESSPDLHNSGMNLYLDLSFFDIDSRHHSIEEEHISTISTCLCSLFLLLFVIVLRRLIQMWKTDDTSDDPVMVFCCVLGIMVCCLACKMAAFWLGSAGLTAHTYFELVHRILFMAGDGLLCVFLILLSKGWGVTKSEELLDKGAEILLGVGLLVARYTWCLIGNFLESERDDLFHLYDGWTGKLEILNLLVFFIWCHISFKREQILKSVGLSRLRLSLITSSFLLYLLRPLMVLISITCATVENQHQLSFTATLGSNFLSCLSFCFILLPRKGIYMRVSSSNKPELELEANSKLS